MIVAIEGADGAGKSTQIALLSERLTSLGCSVRAVEFPRTGTMIGNAAMEKLKDCLPNDRLALQCMLLADRLEAADEITNWNERGAIILIGRWVMSSIVYGSADGLPIDWLYKMAGCLPRADLQVLISTDPVTRGGRLAERNAQKDDVYESDQAFQKKVSDYYKRAWQNAHTLGLWDARWCTVEGSWAKDEVTEAIMTNIVEFLP